MRKIVDYTVQTEGRDKGKTFVITEMPATRAERWAVKAFRGMVKAGVDLPDSSEKQGMAGLAMMSFQALASIPYDDLQPLLDEMFECITIRPDANRSSLTRSLVEDDIEEVTTRLLLRMEWFKLHTSFSLPAVH